MVWCIYLVYGEDPFMGKQIVWQCNRKLVRRWGTRFVSGKSDFWLRKFGEESAEFHQKDGES